MEEVYKKCVICGKEFCGESINLTEYKVIFICINCYEKLKKSLTSRRNKSDIVFAAILNILIITLYGVCIFQ